MFEFMTQHQFWAAVAIYWIFSAAVSSIPDPAPNGGPSYLWLYRFFHTLAGNITTAFGSRIPGLKTLGLILIVPLLFSTSACAARYTIHPGALNKTDSAAYDALLIAQAAIDQARMEYAAKPLPGEAKERLNTLIKSYTVARNSWLTYRGAIASNMPAGVYFDRLTKNLSDLSNAIRTLKEAK